MGVVTHAHACAILLASTNTVSVNTYTHVIWKYYRLWVSEWVFIAVWELLVVACLACSSRSPWLAKVPQDIQSDLHERWRSTVCGDSPQIHHRGWLEEKNVNAVLINQMHGGVILNTPTHHKRSFWQQLLWPSLVPPHVRPSHKRRNGWGYRPATKYTCSKIITVRTFIHSIKSSHSINILGNPDELTLTILWLLLILYYYTNILGCSYCGVLIK